MVCVEFLLLVHAKVSNHALNVFLPIFVVTRDRSRLGRIGRK